MARNEPRPPSKNPGKDDYERTTAPQHRELVPIFPESTEIQPISPILALIIIFIILCGMSGIFWLIIKTLEILGLVWLELF